MITGLVSIITPVYNAGAFLEKTIQSILKQDYTNWQLILIDDGSTDNSGDICDKFSGKDSRIITKHIRNSGVAKARNIGLGIADGEYITFCDSDDIVEPFFISLMVEKIHDEYVDLCIGSFYIDINSSSELFSAPVLGKVEKHNFDIMLTNWYNIFWFTLCNKLFKQEIIKQHNLQFAEGLSMSEDALFVLQYMEKIDDMYCMEDGIYHYIQHLGSSLTHKFNKDRLRGFDIVADEFRQLSNVKGFPQLVNEKELIRQRSEALSAYVYTAFADRQVSKETKRFVYRELKNARKERQLLRKSHNFSSKCIGVFPRLGLSLYFQLLSWIR